MKLTDNNTRFECAAILIAWMTPLSVHSVTERECCRAKRQQAESWFREAEHYGRCSQVGATAGSAVGAAIGGAGAFLGVVTGGAPGLVAKRYEDMAKQRWAEYEACLAAHAEEAAEAARQQAKIAADANKKIAEF